MAPIKVKSPPPSSSKDAKKQTTIKSFFLKASVTSPIRSAPKTSKPRWVGTRVARSFDVETGNQVFAGTVVQVLDPFYHIQYDDGDSEDFDADDLQQGITLYQQHFLDSQHTSEKEQQEILDAPSSSKKENTTNTVQRTVVTPTSDRKMGSRSHNNKTTHSITSVMKTQNSKAKEPPSSKRKRATVSGRSKNQKLSKRAVSKFDDSSSEASIYMTDNDDDDDDDDHPDEDMEFDDDTSSLENVKPTTKRGRPAKSTTTSKAVRTSNAKSKISIADKTTTIANNTALQKELKDKMAKELKAYKSQNNPQKMPTEPYVDPVGVDPTHGIIEGIIATQVIKVGHLLSRISSCPDALDMPIRLQTACSGTDAPSIALALVQETLDKLTPNHTFAFEHVMSCEIEPFKQAYLGRNFPGVPLFPDITKLTASEQVLDVYGRPQPIPQGNIFVAGTSCKDFSMLKTRDRQDIEDKGTSGETFLAAVEFLDKFQPPIAIFENVDGAPWAKMQEYITGRIALSERNNTKAIKDAKKKADADKELVFSVNDNGDYVAEEIPRQVGIRAGSIVEGFVKGGDDATNVQPLKAHGSSKRITLGEIAKKHKINLDADTLVLQKKARYATRLVKLDTKDYGLPQTRNRKYLFIWRSDSPDDDLGEYFQEILQYLETPLLYSMDAFLLPDSHDRIRCFREALRSGPGIMVKRERAKELDFWDWELSHVQDLPRHKVFRQANGIQDRSRWLTGWDTRGRKALAPGLWPELFDCWNMRRLDMVDCFAAAAIRDPISRDPLHHSFTWDLSQNVTRAPFRTSTVGVSACVTPGGELLLPHKGRTVMGYEKLLLQGIPFSRLLLGPETEVQLSDLAGNAMSVSVVCATLLAALCAPQLRRERQTQKNILLSNFRLVQKYDAANGGVLAERGDLFQKMELECNETPFVQILQNLSRDLSKDSFRSSVLCTCESSGTTTKDPKILECADCGFCICHECTSRHQTKSHNLREINVTEPDGRPDPHVFERKLRSAVPPVLKLGAGWETSVEHCGGLESYSFQLQQVDRKRGHWELTWGAYEDYGSARQVAEIRVTIGRTATLKRDTGVTVFLRCFAPAIRQEMPLRGKLPDSARLILVQSTPFEDCRWDSPTTPSKKSLTLIGWDPCPSHRVQIGLNDEASNAFQSLKVNKSFIPNVKSRNCLIGYHPKWKTWPGTIEVTGDASDHVNGTYRRLSCQQTIAHSALWRRDGEKNDNKPTLYLYIRPDVIRSGLDVAVISTTPSYRDGNEICELIDWIPENALDPKTYQTKATFKEWKTLPENLKVEVLAPTMLMTMEAESFHKMVCARSQDRSESMLCKLSGLSSEVIESLLQYNESQSVTDEIKLDLFGRLGTRNAKRLSIIAAPSLLKYAAENKLPLSLCKWYKLPSDWRFGNCEIHVPSRPVERWQALDGRKMAFERVYDAEESKVYYQKLLGRPTAFTVTIDKSKGQLVVSMNPCVAAHDAANRLGRENSSSAEIEYCLAELSSMGEPDTKEFKVPNSDNYNETSVDGLELPLYKRQAKALSRMLAIERGDVSFCEEERSEHVLPGIGWCLIARASKNSRLRGGVLGDAIGSGKTVITIALILKGIEKARSNRDPKTGRSGASLIVVPPGLVKQWDDERKKFTKEQLKCILIDCVATLKRYSVEDLCCADMVIVPAGIIEETPSTGQRRPYTEHLSKKAGAGDIPPAPTHYSQREAPTIEGTWVRNMASGPEIYVGNKGNQRTRDAQAYYGHCYSEAITKLRQKDFSPSERGVPLEYFTWERVIIDECHETLVTGKQHEIKDDNFKEKARRGAREFLGVSQTDPSKRPLVAATGVWGLTGTPLLETEARVTELANLMGGTYLTGAAHHWRKEERESGRDLFLNHQEGIRSREYRRAVQDACHTYVKVACQRNRGEALQVTLIRQQINVNMTASEAKNFIQETSDLQLQSYSITADQLGDKAGPVLSVTSQSKSRHGALLQAIDDILGSEPETKIIVFANSLFGGHQSALSALKVSGRPFCHLSDSASVRQQNEIISWFRHVDATDDDRARPRVLLLSFEQAAGHNLQEACHHVIIYDPMYSGSDAVADASVEEQAVGRVMRQGQKSDVTVTRIAVRGPGGERCIDDWIIERNVDEKILQAATSNFE